MGDCFEGVGGYDETSFPAQYLRAIAPRPPDHGARRGRVAGQVGDRDPVLWPARVLAFPVTGGYAFTHNSIDVMLKGGHALCASSGARYGEPS